MHFEAKYRSDSGEPLTHPPRKSINRDEASAWTLELAEKIVNVIDPNEMYALLEEYRLKALSEPQLVPEGFLDGIT
jgi:hypothetical protein